MLRIGDPAKVLRLVAVPARDVSRDPLFLVLPLSLEGFVLRTDLVEPLRAGTGCVIELTAEDAIVKTGPEYNFKVLLILLKRLVPNVVLSEYLIRTSKGHVWVSYSCPKLQVERPAFLVRLSTDRANLLARHTPPPIGLIIEKLTQDAPEAVLLR